MTALGVRKGLRGGSSSVTVRTLVALLALAAAAWFAVGAHQAQDTTQASAIVSSVTRLSAAQANSASDLLTSAAFLNPDRTVDLLRAQLDLDRGKVTSARRILKAVIRAEPKNLEAWLLMERASASDVRESLVANYVIEHFLAPPIPGTRTRP
jgi:hypothetical protein